VGIRSITIEPPASRWRGLALMGGTGETQQFREQLGLPVDKPVVMSGHQAGIWHAGILAKLEALVAFSEAIGAHPVWLVVDQDDNDPTRIEYPALRDGELSRETWGLTEEPVAPGAPNSQRDAISATDASKSGLDGVDAGLARMASALRERSGASSLAEQFAHAAMDLCGLECAVLNATSLAATDAYTEVFRAMGSDAAGCARAYNAAAEARPDAGIRALTVDDDRAELPLWNIGGSFRKPVYGRDLEGLDVEQTAPKALLMTGLLRSFGCDLFIHGTGGAGTDGASGYDAVTDAWLESWRGEAPRARGVLVTATLTLDLGLDVPTEEEVERAQSLAHKAQHDPSVVGDDASATRKQELVEKIEAAKAEGEKPAGLFREMQELLKSHRERNGEAIARLKDEAEAMSAKSAQSAIAHDRTWAFPLHSVETLAALRSQLGRALSVGGP